MLAKDRAPVQVGCAGSGGGQVGVGGWEITKEMLEGVILAASPLHTHLLTGL